MILPIGVCKFQVAPLQAMRYHRFNQESCPRHEGEGAEHGLQSCYLGDGEL